MTRSTSGASMRSMASSRPDVRGHVNDAQFRRHQHHRDFGRAGQRREQFGVARILVARGMQRLLAERRRADRLRLARFDDAHRALDVAKGRFARDRARSCRRADPRESA